MTGIPAIGDVVREWRQYRQISLTEFSKRTRRSKGYISELEHNKIDNPKLDKLKIMAAVLGITVRDIVSRRMPDKVKDGKKPQLTSPLIRHRRSGALASPIEEQTLGFQEVKATTVGQDIDEVLEGLSQEECDLMREIFVPLARQLVRLRKLNMGG